LYFIQNISKFLVHILLSIALVSYSKLTQRLPKAVKCVYYVIS